jgi:hypothetical protein
MRKIILGLAAGLAITLHCPALFADDEVLTIIEQAVTQYKNNDLADASSNLEYASQLIRQKKGEAMKSLLPEPLAGWESEPATSQALGAAVFGGGITVSRTYTKKPAVITIDIVSDSPLLQSLVMMINNPMIAGASGGKLETVNGQRAIVQYDEAAAKGEVNIVVENRFMVTLKGKKVERSQLISYAAAVDYDALAKN